MAFHLCFSLLKPLLLLLTLCTLGCTKGCVEKERLALVDFKKSFASFSNHGKLSSWNSSEQAKNCCAWEGISCENHTWHVTSLDLFDQGLESSHLRISLLELKHLRSLDLSFNSLAMPIPKFFGSLSRLTSLHIYGAGFFGMIPPQLGNLSNLQSLSLQFNNLSTDNFQWLSHLSSLKDLDMSDTNFSEARDWLSVIKELPLISFVCWGCYFPTPDLPSTTTHHINSSTSLQTLGLSGYMSSKTLSLLVNNTSNLLYLYLQHLTLEIPLPDIFHHMISLESLYLSGSTLDVGIFHSIGSLCNLTTLDASRSITKESFSDIFQALSSGCASSSLDSIDFESSNLTGNIPSLMNFQRLRVLRLNDNRLANFPQVNTALLKHPASNISSGSLMNVSLPNTLPIFPAYLTELYLNNNNLNGILSNAHFANLSNFIGLYFANNPSLTVRFDEVPLTRISHVDFSFCNLGPNFPSWLIGENNISVLHISHSNISDTIPTLFWRNISPLLLYLNFSYNSLCGTVPNIPFSFSDRDLVVDLSSNFLYGQIPFCFFKVDELYLSKNNFSGFAAIIPHQPKTNSYVGFGDTSFASVVDLSNNLLSGLIPEWLGFQMPRLVSLNLANNNLSGTIPSSIGHTLHLYVLNLRNNSFSGPIPSSLQNCTTLRILDLGGNRFSGFIPSWMGEKLRDLIVLSLGSNNLKGIIPTSLCRLNSLQILDLSQNLLAGNIPSCIHELTAMAHDVYSSVQVINVGQDKYNYSIIPLEEVAYFNAYIKWKSRVWQFKSTLRLVKLVDLSSNNLTGGIPKGVASLVGLDSVDLSCNNLEGSIPEQIGRLKALQVLNLSFNTLNGQIPPSLAEISSLEMLDFSHNNLSGRIPKGTQLQGFNASAFAANPDLCGQPLRQCSEDGDNSAQALQPSPSDGGKKEDKLSAEQCFVAGVGTGFTFGFLGILGALALLREWRYAFFKFSTRVGEWVLLVVALNVSKISRKLRLK